MQGIQSDRTVAGPSRPHRQGHRRRIPPLHDGCFLGPEFVYDSEGQPQLFTPNPTSPEQVEAEASSESGFDAGDTPAPAHSADPTHPSSTPSTPFKNIDRTSTHLQTVPRGRIIWVDFPPGDPANPLCFTKRKKLAIVGVAVYFTGITAYATSSYSIGIPSMCAELGCDRIQGAAGLALYAWGFGVAPLVLAPLSEEYGRKWSYIVAVVVFTILHLMMTLWVLPFFLDHVDFGNDRHS